MLILLIVKQLGARCNLEDHRIGSSQDLGNTLHTLGIRHKHTKHFGPLNT